MQYGILGPLEVSVGGVTLDVGGRKQRAVLAVLLTNPNRVVSLDRLVDELWGDDPPARAIGTLQAYISNLRRVLEPDRPARTPPQVLATQPPGYVLRVDPADVDAVRFEAAVAESCDRLAAGDAAGALRLLDGALQLWRGPALADFAGEPFARNEAVRLENLRELAFETRAAAVLQLGEHAAAVGELERLVAEHPLRERLWELLMLALYRSGRQAEALRAYGQARQVLKAELGVSPGPALQALEGDILAQAPSLDWQPPAAPCEAEPPASPAPAVSAPGVSAPAVSAPAVIDLRTAGDHLVGREEPLARLAAARHAAAAGATRLVVVAGPAGIGKTSVVEAFAETARAQGSIVAAGRGVDEQGAPALWPWTQVLRDVLAPVPAAGAGDLLGERAAELAPLLPDLAGPAAGPAPEVDPRFARFRVFDAVAGLLRRAAARRPLVVVLDDLQWADLTSVRLLEFVASEVRDAPLLVVIACRDEAAPEPAITECLATVARQPQSDRIVLRGLDEDGVRRYIAGVAGPEAAERVAREVHRRTGGNPFFVSQLVRLLTSENRLDEDGASAALPAGVRDVVRQRIARLPEDTQSLLVLAAVIGQTFSLDVLLEVSKLDDDRLFELIEPALVTGVLVEAAELGRYGFAHALVRDTLYASLTTVRRARLHAAVARVLEAAADRDSRTSIAERARHWQAAGDRRQTVAASIRAGQESAAVAALDDALEHYERALSCWDEVPDAEDAAGTSRTAVLAAAAEAACYAGRDGRAVELASAAVAATDRVRDPRATALALERLGRYAWLGNDTVTSLAAYEDAVAVLAPLPPSAEQARVLAAHGQALMLRSLFERAVEQCREAIDVARRAGARAAEGHARNSLGSSLTALGWIDEGLAELEEARRIAVELDRPDDLCRALVNRSTRLIACGRIREGVDTALTAMETARRAGMARVYGTFVAANAGVALIRMGRLDEADAVIGDALREPTSGLPAVEVQLAKADLELRRGDLDAARKRLDDVESRIARLDSVSIWGQLWIARAELALLEGDLEEVGRIVREGVAAAEATDDVSCTVELVALGVRAAGDRAVAARGQGDEVAAAVGVVEADRLLAISGRVLARAEGRGAAVFPAARGFALLAAAEAARARGEADAGAWEAAASVWDEVGYTELAAAARARATASASATTPSARPAALAD